MYFLRQYLKGVKGSGTKDIWSGDFVPTEDETLETFGDNGKYIVFQRGKGIRGMKKIVEYGPYTPELNIEDEPPQNRMLSGLKIKAKSDWMPKVFAAEGKTINVKQQIDLEDLSDFRSLGDVIKQIPVAFMGSAMPATGGLYVYCKRVLGPRLGFFYLAVLLITHILIALFALGFAEYAVALVPGLKIRYVAAGILLVFFCVNLVGVKPAAHPAEIYDCVFAHRAIDADLLRYS